MKYDTVLFLRTPGQELLHSIIRFLYLKEAIFTKEELCRLIFISLIIFIALNIFISNTHVTRRMNLLQIGVISNMFRGFEKSDESNYLLVML